MLYHYIIQAATNLHLCDESFYSCSRDHRLLKPGPPGVCATKQNTKTALCGYNQMFTEMVNQMLTPIRCVDSII